jgi:hypothetical protein
MDEQFAGGPVFTGSRTEALVRLSFKVRDEAARSAGWSHGKDHRYLPDTLEVSYGRVANRREASPGIPASGSMPSEYVKVTVRSVTVTGKMLKADGTPGLREHREYFWRGTWDSPGADVPGFVRDALAKAYAIMTGAAGDGQDPG